MSKFDYQSFFGKEALFPPQFGFISEKKQNRLESLQRKSSLINELLLVNIQWNKQMFIGLCARDISVQTQTLIEVAINVKSI